jgi:hypothetical protein
MALSSRDKNLAQARCVTDKGLRLMFVDFAKEAHREYLRCLKQIKLYDERRRKHVDCARRMQDNMHEESILTIQRLTNLCRNTGEWDFVRQWKWHYPIAVFDWELRNLFTWIIGYNNVFVVDAKRN